MDRLHDPAQAAFQEGLEIFKKCLTHDVEKRSHADQLHTCKLEELVSSVVAAQTHYQGKRGNNKIRKCIVAFSRRVCYYGDIMDILVQHHPEYVSLAWGAIKFLFGVRNCREYTIGLLTLSRPSSSMNVLG